MRLPSVLLREWEVLAYLAGRKTMIARPIIPQPEVGTDCPYHVGEGTHRLARRCPFGRPGDVLAGKEAWSVSSAQDDVPSSELPSDLGRQYLVTERHFYLLGKKRRAQHMPPWAVRIHLRVEAVCAKRAGEITAAEFWGLSLDVFAPNAVGSWRDVLGAQWDADYPRYPWASNPWIWLARAPRVTPEEVGILDEHGDRERGER